MATARKKSKDLLEPILADTFGLERLFKATPLMTECQLQSGYDALKRYWRTDKNTLFFLA